MGTSEVGESSLIEAIPAAVLVVETDSWLVREASRAAESLLGSGSDSMVGTSIDSLQPEDTESILSDTLATMADKDGTRSRRELRGGTQIAVTTGSGEKIPVEVRTRRDTDGDDRLVIVLRDISEEIQQARRSWITDRAVENAFDAIYITDEYGSVRRVNEAFEETTGYDGEQIRDLGVGILEPDEGTLVDRYDEREGASSWVEERTFERATGEQYLAKQTVIPISGLAKRVDRFVVVHRDVTESRLQSQQLDVFHRVLRHDLRNAVTVIQGQSDVLLQRCENSHCQERLQTIQNRATGLMETSRKARDARETVSRESDELGGENLRVVLDRLLADMDTSYPDATVAFEQEVDESVQIDHRATTVVRELVENAFEHAGGAAPSVSVTVERVDAGVAVTISDDGPGIEDDEREALQSKQEDPLRHTSGLGLWLVNWIADTLGGTVDIQVTGHEGTTVTATFPTTTE